MSRIRASLYVFCLEKASEALRNAEMADTHRDYEYWCGLEAKWNDLGDYYYRGEPKMLVDSAANPSDVARIDAARKGGSSAWEIDRGEGVFSQQKAVDNTPGNVVADNIALRVDTERKCGISIREIDCFEVKRSRLALGPRETCDGANNDEACK